MTTRVTHVITDARACRCFDASERTSASASRAPASIRPVILPPSQVAKRVSSIAPVSSSTISSPLPRAHKPTAGRGAALSGIAIHHGRTAAGKYSHAAERAGWLDSTRTLSGQVAELLRTGRSERSQLRDRSTIDLQIFGDLDACEAASHTV